MKSKYKNLNINLKYFSTTSNLIKYINGAEGRKDPITKFIVYSHGFEDGTVSFGYDYTINYNKDLNFYKEDIKRINKKAFANPDSRFESCNTGTGDDSFAKNWKQRVGGNTWAYQGKSTYEHIMYPSNYSSFDAHFIRDSVSDKTNARIISRRKKWGFSRTGSDYYPEAGNRAFRRKF